MLGHLGAFLNLERLPLPELARTHPWALLLSANQPTQSLLPQPSSLKDSYSGPQLLALITPVTSTRLLWTNPILQGLRKLLNLANPKPFTLQWQSLLTEATVKVLAHSFLLHRPLDLPGASSCVYPLPVLNPWGGMLPSLGSVSIESYLFNVSHVLIYFACHT